MIKHAFKYFLIAVGFAVMGLAFFRYSSIGSIKNIRAQVVATAITTMSYQQIAYIAAPHNEVNIIMSDMFMGNDAPVYMDTITVINPETNFTINTEGYDLLGDGIYIRDIAGDGFNGKLMLLTDASRIFVSTAENPGKEGATVKSMTAANDAVGGINGGWFSGFAPMGFVISKGELVFPGSDCGSPANIAGFTEENRLIFGAFTAQEALEMGVRDCLVTYPVIIVNGEPQITTGDGSWGIAPRTAIAQRSDGAVLFLTIDGRQWHSWGATLRQVQDLLLENGAVNAICLDGGSSTAMYFNGDYLNKPSLGFERYIANAFLIL